MKNQLMNLWAMTFSTVQGSTCKVIRDPLDIFQTSSSFQIRILIFIYFSTNFEINSYIICIIYCMFELTKCEMENWRSQYATSNKYIKMGLRRLPYHPAPLKSKKKIGFITDD